MNGMLIIAFELGITQWTRRFRPRPMIALGYLLAGIGFALTGLAESTVITVPGHITPAINHGRNVRMINAIHFWSFFKSFCTG